MNRTDNAFLKMPHIFKPLQTVLYILRFILLFPPFCYRCFINYGTMISWELENLLNAIVLSICIGSTAGSENALIWFIVIFSLLVSAAATVIFAMNLQDQLLDSVSNGQVAWNAVELAYSFLFCVLSILGIWLSFSLSGKHPGGSSAGYIAAGLFFVLHTGLYGFPVYVLYNEVQNQRREEAIQVQATNPFHDVPYQQDL